MQAVTVVIGFDVLENGLFHGIPCGKSFTVDAFYFQGMEKALGAGVVGVAGGAGLRGRATAAPCRASASLRRRLPQTLARSFTCHA